MGFADIHIHSVYSYDATGTIPAILKFAAERTDLDIIAITDHDSMRGVHLAQSLAPQYGVHVVPGCEVSTSDGHLLTLFVAEQIPAGLSLIDTVLRARDLGGLCVVPHPQAAGTSSVRYAVLQASLENERVRETLVGIETFNGGLVYTRSNQDARGKAREFGLSALGNSDAHILEMIGQGATGFAGYTLEDFRNSLLAGKTFAREGHRLSGSAVLRRYLPRYFLRRLGWAAWTSGPQAPIKMTRLSQTIDQQPG
jgi:predicted metal-dependent phosphoesterase TrpH